MSAIEKYMSAAEANAEYQKIQKAENDEAIKRCCEDIFKKISENIGKGEIDYPYGQGAPAKYDDPAAVIDSKSIGSVIALLHQAQYKVDNITPQPIDDRVGYEQPRNYLRISWKNVQEGKSNE